MKAIIVGSGAGGSTVAKELSGNSIDVTLIEKGPKIAEKEAFMLCERWFRSYDSQNHMSGWHYHSVSQQETE